MIASGAARATSRDTSGKRPLQRPAQRREQLLMRSSALRLQFALEARALEAPLALADRVRDGLGWLRGHPELLAGAVLLLALLRPRQAWRWATRGWWARRLWQRLCSAPH